MKTELEKLSYEDTLVELNMMCEQAGCRAVLRDFRTAYPSMFEELKIQINRLDDETKRAALLR